MNKSKHFVSLALTVFVSLSSFAQRIVCDETCKVEFQHPADEPSATTSTSAKLENSYAVVSPVGRGTVEMIQQAERLTTLAGKTIAVVGESFMTSITHP